jgi:arabinofuranosyltransferase
VAKTGVTIQGGKKLPVLAGAALLILFLVRTAWCSEDAYIGFRVVENFLRGQGLTWNVGERVQVYTDPLFEFLIIAATWISGSVYWSSIVVSLLLSLAAYFFLMSGRRAMAILLGTTILLTSKGFMDFSVSGLENPATHLAVAAYAWVYWRKRDPFWLTLIASLAAVNRMDSALLFAPSLLWLYCRTGWRVWKPALLGATPFLAWEAFSLFYYGFLFPNTAYAKLNTGIPASDLIEQGIRYIQSAISWDTVTVLTIAGGIGIGSIGEDWPLALGAVMSMIYVVRVGGDYMSGRFLTPAFMLCCAILVQHAPKKRIHTAAMSGAALLFGMLIVSPTLLTTRDFGPGYAVKEYLGVTDERAYMYRSSGLLHWRADIGWPDHFWREEGLKLRNSGTRFAEVVSVGIIPYFAGPNVYVYDKAALGDALTARMPMPPRPWRTGHYWREPPAGYTETLKTGVNQIQDKNLAEYYEHLRKIIRGDLWDVSRWKEIIAMNLGFYDHLLRR